MSQNRPIGFKILSLDSLGQGVSKTENRITFIPKTLPGEEGVATIQSEKKGVAFARALEITTRAAERISPECPHFAQCPSCHYLHAPYERELAAKKESFEQLTRKLPLPGLKVVPAPRRFSYRNRIQLHFDTKLRQLGMLDARTSTIVPVPQCLIPVEPIRTELKRLYENDQWLRFVPKGSTRGHVELYLREGMVLQHWNEAYASGGFTQVFAEMNEALRLEIQHWYGSAPGEILDLFAGDGNLSNNLPYSARLCVDVYTEPKGSDFLSQSLYHKGALQRIRAELGRRNLRPHTLLLDPPRSGLSDLQAWLEELKPGRVAYVSCDPHTMVRDLLKVEDYRPTGAVLLDFFPSTFHFESLIFLERK